MSLPGKEPITSEQRFSPQRSMQQHKGGGMSPISLDLYCVNDDQPSLPTWLYLKDIPLGMSVMDFWRRCLSLGRKIYSHWWKHNPMGWGPSKLSTIPLWFLMLDILWPTPSPAGFYDLMAWTLSLQLDPFLVKWFLVKYLFTKMRNGTNTVNHWFKFSRV